MSDSRMFSISDLGNFSSIAKAQESLWKAYGSRENWEEVKALVKQIGRLEAQNAAMQEQIEKLELENKALLQGWTERKKEVN